MWLQKAKPGAEARRDHHRAGARGGEKANEETGPPSARLLPLPSPVMRIPSPKARDHSPPGKGEVDN